MNSRAVNAGEVPRPTPKGITRTLGTKVKEIKVGTIMEITTMTGMGSERDQGNWWNRDGPENDRTKLICHQGLEEPVANDSANMRDGGYNKKDLEKS
ncbi:hypothetical protein HAX54_003238 [Datura stramonium]|uniref:Uncharacterized protein n=1 Tax=Datura stramonium TaxID=4076 RepID=A0ABS8WS17_DATST|nr:hypothetical protein [Datura stramonium]